MESSNPEAHSTWIRAVVAAAVFACGLATAFHGYWGADPTLAVPVPTDRPMDLARTRDLQLTAWGTSRNAWTFLHRPSGIFDAEPCYPERNSLTTDHPRLTLGLLGIPFQVLTRDPVATFNGVIFASVLLAALAMYLLVVEWTGVPSAGIVAAVLYAFSAQQIEKTFHIMVTDNAWLLLALFFARRTLTKRRWRDAIGLGVSAALQVGSSIYASLAAAAGAIPMMVWLLWLNPPDRRTLAMLAVSATMLAGAAWFVFAPYAAGDIVSVGRGQFFLPWSGLLPGRTFFPGWTTLVLVFAAFALPRRGEQSEPGRGARVALLLAALTVALLATGGNERAQYLAARAGEQPWLALPNPYRGLAVLVPSLNGVRLAKAIAHGIQPILCVLAGIGVAALLRRLPRRVVPLAAAALAAIAFLDTLRPAFLGLADSPRFSRHRIAPASETLDLFATLERGGNDGPMMELPVLRQRPNTGIHRTWRNDLTEQHWHTAYHHRRTTSCSGSVIDHVVPALEAATVRFANDMSLAADLYARGITTIIVHHPEGATFERLYANTIAAAAKSSEGWIRRIGSNAEMTAYELHEDMVRTQRPARRR